MTISERKKAMRAQALAARAQLRAAMPEASARLKEKFVASIPVPAGSVVSAYIGIGEEADPAPLINTLRVRGCSMALPRIAAKRAPLVFHRWEEGAALVPGPFGLSQPAPDWPIADPDVLIVPLLAFDARGNRLGYGAGFYDASLRDLRARTSVLAVGYAFSGQEMPEIPHDSSDERLDWIVTECYARKF